MTAAQRGKFSGNIIRRAASFAGRSLNPGQRSLNPRNCICVSVRRHDASVTAILRCGKALRQTFPTVW